MIRTPYFSFVVMFTLLLLSHDLPAQPVTPALVPALSASQAKKVIEKRARRVVNAIKAKDWKRFAKFVHPKKGVCFTPYPAACEKPIQRSELKGLAKHKEEIRHWGAYDGSGEAMDLTLEKYWARFLYDHDFAAAPQVLYNEFVHRGGNFQNPLKENPAAILVEFHNPNSATDKTDWASLRLIFEKLGSTWFLTLVQHDEWTI